MWPTDFPGLEFTIPDFSSGINLALGMIVLGTSLLVFVWSIGWVMDDAKRRGQSGCLMGFMVFVSWPWGLVMWLLFRPRKQPRVRILYRCPEPGCGLPGLPHGSLLRQRYFHCAAGHEFTESAALRETVPLQENQ